MPSKQCPECGKIVISSQIPNYCAWCGCSLKEQPLCDICEIYKTSEGKPLFGSKCHKLSIPSQQNVLDNTLSKGEGARRAGGGLSKEPETEAKQADLQLSGADALLAELRKQREEREKAPVQLNMFKA